jgi:hypothetical protein
MKKSHKPPKEHVARSNSFVPAKTNKTARSGNPNKRHTNVHPMPAAGEAHASSLDEPQQKLAGRGSPYHIAQLDAAGLARLDRALRTDDGLRTQVGCDAVRV